MGTSHLQLSRRELLSASTALVATAILPLGSGNAHAAAGQSKAGSGRTLLALMERPGRVVTRDHLQQVVYGGDGSIESNTIAVFIHQLRRKLGDDVIVTVHGQGYMIGEPRS